jgi:ABC-2 type transport system permease protein
MREALALTRADWLAATSYRTRVVLSFGSMVAAVIPIYFVAQALQPMMAESITAQGGEYFGFVLLGMAATNLIAVSVQALPGAISKGIGDGTLEALLSTRASLPTLLAGLLGYRFIWTGLRIVALLAAGVAFGMQLVWTQALSAVAILLLIGVAHLPFALLATAMVLAVRTAGPIGSGVLALSALLGGVYYPTHVIPSWIQHVSSVLPLTYGLRALRQTLLGGESLTAVLPDLLILSAFAIALWVMGSVAFHYAIRYARRAGTLAQY